MTPAKEGAYEFKADSLIAIRNHLKLSQGKMAKMLEVPQNTLSRWENGTTVPDAGSLASIYSVAKEHGITPGFFGVRKSPKGTGGDRYRLLVMWDLRTMNIPGTSIPEADSWIRAEVNRRFGGTTQRLFKVFAHPTWSVATDILAEKGWRIFEYDRDIDEEIIDHSRSDAGHDPSRTILVLITGDKHLVDLIDEMQAETVRVYLMGPERVGQELINKVGRRRWIEWNRGDFSLPILF